MRTKVFFFLWCMLLLVACGGGDDSAQEEPEKPKSTHYISQYGYKRCQFGGFIEKDGTKNIWFSMFSDDTNIDLVIDKETLPRIPGTGIITDANVYHKIDSNRHWEMRSVNYGRYAFRGGTADFQFDGDGWNIHLSFGPIVDSDGVMDIVDISCWIKDEDVVVLSNSIFN